MSGACKRPNAFPWRPPAEGVDISPSHVSCGTQQHPNLFTGSVPALIYDPVLDDDDIELSVDGIAVSDPGGNVLYNPETDEYADCVGAAARARLRGSEDTSEVAPVSAGGELIGSDDGSPSLEARKGVESLEVCDRRVPVGRVIPWAKLARARQIVPEPPVAELMYIDAPLRRAFFLAHKRAETDPHRLVSCEVLSILLGASSPLVGGEIQVDRVVSLPPLASAAIDRLKRENVTKSLDVSRFHRLVRFRNECISTNVERPAERGSGVIAWAPDFDGIVIRASACGQLYKTLSLFVDCYGAGPLDSTLRSSCVFISSVLSHYAHSLLSRVEGNSRDAGTFPVSALSLLVEAEELASDLYCLFRATALLESTLGSSCEVLETLYQLSYRHSADQVLYKLFLTAAVPYFRMLWDWIFSASCTRDRYDEFFGTVLGTDLDGPEDLVVVNESFDRGDLPLGAAPFPAFLGIDLARSVLRAGRARALLSKVDPGHPLLKVAAPCFDDVFDRGFPRLADLETAVSRLAGYAESIDAVSTSAIGDPMEPSDPDKYEAHTSAMKPRLPSVWSCPTSARSVFSFPVDLSFPPSALQTGGRSLGPSDVKTFWSGSFENAGDLERPVPGSFEIGWPTVVQCIHILVVSPLRRVDTLVQQAVCSHFTDVLRVHDHLSALWRYALFGAGDFADILVERIESASSTVDANELFMLQRASSYEGGAISRLSSAPSTTQTRQRTHLAECLQSALIASGADSDPFASRICIRPIDPSPEGSTWSRSLWDNEIHVSYRAEFPLNFLISPNVMDRYSVFFNFFLRVRRAEQCLRRLFMTCRRQSSLRAHSTFAQRALLDDAHLCTRIWRFCWEAEHFVRIVGEYEATQVVGSSWPALIEQQDQSRTKNYGVDIWGLRNVIIEFLDSSTRRALLGKRHESVMKVIASALDVVVELEKLLMPAADPARRYNSSEIADFISHVNAASDSLQRRAKFLVVVLQKLVSSGAAASQPHLTDLLNRLNYNNFY